MTNKLDEITFTSAQAEKYIASNGMKINWDGKNLTLNGVIYSSHLHNNFNESLSYAMSIYLGARKLNE